MKISKRTSSGSESIVADAHVRGFSVPELAMVPAVSADMSFKVDRGPRELDTYTTTKRHREAVH